jgi:AraC-like DNA-binding protein
MPAETAPALWTSVPGTPDPRLRGHVISYTGYSECTPGPLRRLEAATLVVPMILSLGPAIRVDGVLHRSFVAGVGDGANVTEHDGVQLGIQVNLTPLGARRLLGVPMRELTSRVIVFEDLLGRDGVDLIALLCDEAEWARRFAHIDAALVSRLAVAAPIAPEVVRAWSLLEASEGAVAVERLARDVGWSRRHLTARFSEEIGLAPKTAARVLRFERVSSLLRSGAAGLADAAYACGYADQSHLNREFRALAGTTPGDYAARVMPEGRGVAA